LQILAGENQLRMCGCKPAFKNSNGMLEQVARIHFAAPKYSANSREWGESEPHRDYPRSIGTYLELGQPKITVI
jgi:hypothetical protein